LTVPKWTIIKCETTERKLNEMRTFLSLVNMNVWQVWCWLQTCSQIHKSQLSWVNVQLDTSEVEFGDDIFTGLTTPKQHCQSVKALKENNNKHKTHTASPVSTLIWGD